jgi:uncharacterized protein YggE
MQRVAIVSTAVFLFSLVGASAGSAAAQAPTAPPEPGDVVVTSGTGLVKSAPDRAFVTVSAEARARTPREAQGQNARAMTAVQQRLEAAGIPAEAVRTLTVDLQPEFDWANGKQTLRGYVARNSIEVRLDDMGRVGEVIDASVGSGATSISDIRFDVKDRPALEREALKQAVADARSRAEALAAASGREIERITRIDDSGAAVQPPPRPMLAMRAEAAAAPATPVTPGEVEVRASVTLTARLK